MSPYFYPGISTHTLGITWESPQNDRCASREGPEVRIVRRIRDMTLPKWIRWCLEHPRIGRFLRYGVGSAVASAVSAITLALVYHAIGTGPQVASLTAFIAGALVNFLLYRFWAWRATLTPDAERPRRFAGDVLKYSAVAVTTALVALGTTTLADHYARAHHLADGDRTLLVEGSYFGAFAVMFVAKFVVLDRFVFTSAKDDDDATRLSRSQVETTTRA
jgi:putative flippase GtrA